MKFYGGVNYESMFVERERDTEKEKVYVRCRYDKIKSKSVVFFRCGVYMHLPVCPYEWISLVENIMLLERFYGGEWKRWE